MADPQLSADNLRPRVVRLITRLNVGGPSRHVAWLDDGLKGQYESTLITGSMSAGEDDMIGFVRSLGVEPIVVADLRREISWRDLPAIWRVYRLFVALKPDIIDTHTSKAGFVGRIAALLYSWLTPTALIGKRRKCHLVHTFHGHVFHSYFGRVKTRLILMIERLLAKITDRIVVTSPGQLEEIHGVFGIGLRAQFAMIPLGIDLDTFDGSQSRRQALRNEVGATSDDVLVGVVGRLVDVKNHDLFLNSVVWFLSHYGERLDRRVRFLVVGGGMLHEPLRQRVRQLNLEDCVVFTGVRNDPEVFYPGLDIVMLTSKNEGTPMSLIEAMTNGRPVLATAVGGVPDIIGLPLADQNSAGDDCTLHQHGISAQATPRSLAAGVFRLANDDELRAELGARGAEFAHRSHSKERLVNDIDALYRDLLLEIDAACTRELPEADPVSLKGLPPSEDISDVLPSPPCDPEPSTTHVAASCEHVPGSHAPLSRRTFVAVEKHFTNHQE